MTQASKNVRPARRWPYLLILMSALLLYSNTFQHGFVLDDDVVLLKNRYVQEGIGGIDDILSHGFLYGFNQKSDQSYRPVVLTSFAIEKSLFGLDPTPFHIINVLAYALLGCLIFLFFKRLLLNYPDWLPLWLALLYVFHPIHTEVVANIKGRDEIYHAIFGVLSLYFILKYYDAKHKHSLIFALLSFFLALLSKEMAVTLVAIVPLSLYFFRPIQLKELINYSLPFFGVLIIYFLIRMSILDNVTFEEQMTVINNSLAAAPDFWSRIASNLLIFGNYISLLFFPHPLAWDYSYPHFPIVGFNYPLVILTTILLLSAIILGIKGSLKKSPYAYAFFFFLISFSVVSNFFILIGSTLGERFLFFPSIGFCLFLILVFKDLSEQIFGKLKARSPLMVLLSVILLLYAFKTVDRNADWESNERLFIAGYEATADNSRAVSAIASIHRDRGEQSDQPQVRKRELSKARDLYLESIKLYRENTDAFYNLGVTYTNLNRDSKAEMAYKRVLDLNPTHVRALNNLGVIYFQRSDYSGAEELFKRALAQQADFQNAYANLGAVYHNLGRSQEAEKNYRKALELNPEDRNTRENLNKLMN